MIGLAQLEEPRWRCLASIGLGAMLLAVKVAGAETSGNRPPQSQPVAKNTTTGPPSIVAWVDATPVYYREVERGIAAASVGKKISAERLPRLQATVLQELIDQKILLNFVKNSRPQPSSAEIDAALDSFTKKLQEQNQNLQQFLEQNKTSEAALRKQIAQELTLQMYISQNTTDDALQQYFHDHQPQFDGTQRRVSHIILRPVGMMDEAAMHALLFQAQQLRGRIVVGELSFESAAKRYSIGPSRNYGGDVGYISRQGETSESFSEAAFALEPNEISQPVVDSFGIHLIKVTDLKPGHTTWQEARAPLTAAYSHTVLGKLLEELHSKAKIEFSERFPHFLPGTRELASPQPVGVAP